MADAYTLHLSAPASAVVGGPILIQATGVDPPPDRYWAGSWIEVVSIPTSVMTTCPASDEDATSVATATGGSVLAISLRPNLDPAGNFANTIGASATTPGLVLICGYQDDGAGLTLARDWLTIDVLPALPPTPTPAPTPTPSPAPTPTPPSPLPPTGPPATTPSPGARAKPANLARPRITRSAQRLTCQPGRWSNQPARYAFGWLVGGKRIPGQSSQNLRLSHATRGRTVQCTVSASNAAGRTTAVSRPLKIR